MSSSDDSSFDIMNVRTIIDTAFGDIEGNTVNFRLIQAVLYLLARQLRILDRRVMVEIPFASMLESSSSIEVTEVKVHAITGKPGKPDTQKKKTGSSPDKTTEKSSSSNKDSSSKSTGKSAGKQADSTKTSPGTVFTKKDKKREGDKDSSVKREGDKDPSAKREGDKDSSAKTATGKDASGKTTADKDASGKTAASKDASGKTTADKDSSSKAKASKDAAKAATGKDSPDLPRGDKDSTKTAAGKGGAAKTTTGERKEGSSDRGKVSGKDDKAKVFRKSEQMHYLKTLDEIIDMKEKELRVIRQRADSHEEPDPSPTPMASVASSETQYEKLLVVERVPSRSSRDGRPAPKISVVTQEEFEKLANTVRELEDRFKPIGSSFFPENAELMENLRKNASLTDAMAALQLSARLEAAEKVLEHMTSILTGVISNTPDLKVDSQLRVIHEAGSTTGPEASSRSKKSLAARGTSAQPGAALQATDSSGAGLGPTVISTQPETGLAEAAFAPSGPGPALDQTGVSSYPQAGFTPTDPTSQPGTAFATTGPSSDPGAALGPTDLTSQPGTALATEGAPSEPGAARGLADLSSHPEAGFSPAGLPSQPGAASTQSSAKATQKTDTSTSADTKNITTMTGDAIEEERDKPKSGLTNQVDEYITKMDLDKALSKLGSEFMKKVSIVTARNASNAEQALKLATTFESKLNSSLAVAPRMANLESTVSAYADQINALDTGLSSQMTNYQEQLTQMQHELEVGMDAMTEALANAGGDTVAMSELNNNFLCLQSDFESMTLRQKAVRDSQDALKGTLTSIWKQIEVLRGTKADRDEVIDALRDKAGIGDLNGLVPMDQFNAVRGDMEKKIAASYDKFNNQEIVWQKAIDDLQRELGEKGDLIQLFSLKEEMIKYLDAMRARMQFISDIVGEPKAAIVNKKLFRDTACICCSSPAVMDLKKPEMLPALPKFGKSAEDDGDKKKPTGDGDHKPCYFGLPILHPIDPRAHFCRRYCGGSHTCIAVGPSKLPGAFTIKTINKDEPCNEVEVTPLGLPCIPCNKPLKEVKLAPPPSPIGPKDTKVADEAQGKQEDVQDTHRKESATLQRRPSKRKSAEPSKQGVELMIDEFWVTHPNEAWNVAWSTQPDESPADDAPGSLEDDAPATEQDPSATQQSEEPTTQQDSKAPAQLDDVTA